MKELRYNVYRSGIPFPYVRRTGQRLRIRKGNGNVPFVEFTHSTAISAGFHKGRYIAEQTVVWFALGVKVY